MVILNLVVAFVLVLGPTIFFHELGHFLAAKASGVKVYEFALGFGPALLRRRGRDTVYSLRLLPLGGFVKLAGMDIPEDEDAIIPDEDESSFNKKSLSQRLAVIAAGPIMNFVLAVVLFAVYMGLVFIPPTVQVVEPGSPAAEVGLLPGDVITEVAGEKIASIREINSIVARHPDQEIPITILRENRPLRLTITPRLDRELGRARLGIGMVEKERQSPGQALYTGLRQTYFVSRDIVLSIVRMITGRDRTRYRGTHRHLPDSRESGQSMTDVCGVYGSRAQYQPRTVQLSAHSGAGWGLACYAPLEAARGAVPSNLNKRDWCSLSAWPSCSF